MAAEFNNRPIAYIAGALNAMACDYVSNIHRMVIWANRIQKLGYSVYVPCEDIIRGICLGNYGYDDLFSGSQPFLYLSSIVFVVPGWESSKGTKKELESALALGIPIFFDEDGYLQLTEKRLPKTKTIDEIREFHRQTNCPKYDSNKAWHDIGELVQRQREEVEDIPNIIDRIVSDSASLNEAGVRFILARYVQKLKDLKPQTVSGCNTINEILSSLKKMGVEI